MGLASDAVPHPPASRRFEATVIGRVQGVGFRMSTLYRARQIELAGWVANARDGSVHVTAEGPKDALDELLAYLHDGPSAARVHRVDVTWAQAQGDLGPFEIR